MENKIIQMTIGRGPSECAWALPKIFSIFQKEAVQEGVKIEVFSREKDEGSIGLKSITMQVSGQNLDLFLKQWVGSIKWIGKSPIRTFHKRKNWFIGVFEIDKSIKINVRDEDIEYQSMRSSGAGGQHVNKVNSAIRAVHKPTGVSAMGKERRSQLQNKKAAKERLLNKLMVYQLEQVKQGLNSNWNNHLNIQRGNPVRTFNFTKPLKKDPKKSFKKKRSQLKNDLRNFNE